MSEPKTKPDPIQRFIDDVQSQLLKQVDSGVKLPLRRKKLRSIVAACGQRTSKRLLEKLEGGLNSIGIYTDPSLTAPILRLDDWVLFSTGPLPPDSAFFPRETDLQKFVESCLGSGPFRGLELFDEAKRKGWEYRLRTGQRIDLLCRQRRRSGPEGLVVIELKRSHEYGIVDQVISYIKAVREEFQTDAVSGIIVSGREDKVASAALEHIKGYDIRWLCYQVSFNELCATTSGRP